MVDNLKKKYHRAKGKKIRLNVYFYLIYIALCFWIMYCNNGIGVCIRLGVDLCVFISY